MTHKLPQAPVGATRRAAAQVRVSTDRQAEQGLSLTAQHDVCVREIERRGWTLTEVYAEGGVSGAADSRPILDRMLAEAEAGRFDVLVIPKLDRLGRSARVLFNVHQRLRDAGVELVCLSPTIDATTAHGRAQLGMLAVFAEFEREMIGERVRDSHAKRAAEGRHTGRAPLGYRNDAGRLVVVEAEAELVRRIFRECVSGSSQQAIAQRLLADGLPTKHGGDWHQGTVSKVLANRVYIGERLAGDEWHPGRHTPIIDPETWARAEVLRASGRKGGASGRRPSTPTLFRKGFLRCGVCGESMVPRVDPHSAFYFCHSTKKVGAQRRTCPMQNVPIALLDDAVLRYFEQVGLDVDTTRSNYERAVAAKLAEVRTLLADAEREHARVMVELERMHGYFRAGRIEPEEWRSECGELKGELEAADARVKQLRAQEQAVATGAALVDAEEEVLRRLSRIRGAVGSIVADAGRQGEQAGRDLDAVRAALMSLFSGFTLHTFAEPPVGECQGCGASYDGQTLRAPADARFCASCVYLPAPPPDGWLVSNEYAHRELLLPGYGGLWLEPHPRPEMVVVDESAGGDLRAAFPVLRRVPALDLSAPVNNDALGLHT